MLPRARGRWLWRRFITGYCKRHSDKPQPCKRNATTICVALKVYAETRKRGPIDALHGLGLCVSYDRTLAISTDVANSVGARFESEGVMCPPQAVTGVFTTAVVDKIYHNPSFTTITGIFPWHSNIPVTTPNTVVPRYTKGSDRNWQKLARTTCSVSSSRCIHAG